MRGKGRGGGTKERETVWSTGAGVLPKETAKFYGF